MTNAHSGTVLIVDDDPNALRVLSSILTQWEYAVLEARDVDGACSLIAEQEPDTVITDIKMPDRDGTELYDYISKHVPDLPVIFLTAYGSVESAVQAITNGAFYYFIKPPDYTKLRAILQRAVEQQRLRREVTALRQILGPSSHPIRIIGSSPDMRKVFQTIESIKDSPSSVLIGGETGTGKEVVARTLHYGSVRSDRPFIAVNCAAIPQELIEAELFGYERGAFTGASSSRRGRFEEAAGGTVFLDEVSELNPSLQAKFLRVLQERELERLGSNKRISVDFRLISSTNRDLREDIAAGTFRRDLFYRLNVIELRLPPLRNRMSDLSLLAAQFVDEFCRRDGKRVVLTDAALGKLKRYHWPGNIRQLRNVIEQAVVLCHSDRILPRDLPPELNDDGPEQPSVFSDGTVRPLREMEIEAVHAALGKCNGNKSKAARMLGISRKSLYQKLK